jgi:anti-anti-sigma regulatory factor
MRDGTSTIVSWNWQNDRTIVVKPCGEIGGAQAHLVCAVLRRAMAHKGRRVILDLSEVTALDHDATVLLKTAVSPLSLQMHD